MPSKIEALHTGVAQIVTGHFDEKPGYETWREHGTQDWLMIATLEGGGRFGSGSATLTSEAGDLALFRPGACHDYGAAPDRGHWELLWTHFHPRPNWTPWLRWPETAPGRMYLSLSDPILRGRVFTRFSEAHHLATGALRRRETFAMNALEEVLLWCDTQNPLSESASLDRRVADALDYLARHLAEPLSLEEPARRSGLSVSRLSRLFRRQVGQTPQQFLEGQRLHRARQLLELTFRPISAIAAEVGYENPFYFTLRFKRLTGLSPRDYRREHSAGQPEIR